MNKRITDKDKKDWEDFLSKKDKLPNKDLNQIDKRAPKIVTIDLHGYTLDEANIKIDDLINKSYAVTKVLPSPKPCACVEPACFA